MRIPHVVPQVIMGAYQPTPEELEVMEEADRVPFPAGDFHWDDALIPTLKELALQQLAKMFDIVQPMEDILQQDINTLMEILPLDVDLHVTVPIIFYEIYWKRCCQGKWPDTVITPDGTGDFWKRRFLKMYLEEYFETANPEVFDIDHSEDLCTLISDYIFTLNIKQLQMTPCPPKPNCKDGIVRDECIRPDLDIPLDHIPLHRALASLKNLTEIRIVFGIKKMAENLDWRAFQFSIEDCESICAGLSDLASFRVLCINRAHLDCVRAKIFFRFICDKVSIEEVDFSHCQIGDEGLSALGGLLMEHENLKVVRMRNNAFGDEGLKGLGHAIFKGVKSPLETLDLGMNFMTEQGATYLASALIRSKKRPTHLIISCCGFAERSAVLIAGSLELNRGIIKLDITSNDFSEEAEARLIKSLTKNKRLLEIDFRHCGISEEGKIEIDKLLVRNKKYIGVNIEKDDPEIPLLYLRDPEYLIWEYNPKNPDHEPDYYPPRIPET